MNDLTELKKLRVWGFFIIVALFFDVCHLLNNLKTRVNVSI